MLRPRHRQHQQPRSFQQLTQLSHLLPLYTLSPLTLSIPSRFLPTRAVTAAATSLLRQQVHRLLQVLPLKLLLLQAAHLSPPLSLLPLPRLLLLQPQQTQQRQPLQQHPPNPKRSESGPANQKSRQDVPIASRDVSSVMRLGQLVRNVFEATRTALATHLPVAVPAPLKRFESPRNRCQSTTPMYPRMLSLRLCTATTTYCHVEYTNEQF